MNERIIQFIKKQTCATVSCVDEHGNSYCFNCFYAFNSEDGLLYFKSSDDTHHSKLMKMNSQVSGTILPDKLNKLLVKGIQFTGTIIQATNLLAEHASVNYYNQHPIGLSVPGDIWTIEMNWIKMTDTSIGFGKKIIWGRE